MSQKNRQFVLDQIPKGKLGTENFRLTEAPIPSAGEDEVLLRARYVSLDAANRAAPLLNARFEFCGAEALKFKKLSSIDTGD